MSVRVRYAPSPTGLQHIGGARTALFNFLFARSQGGTFITRIEDTDRERFDPAAEQDIYEMLEWLGISPDEGPRQGGDHGPYVQSRRKDIYHTYIQKLLEQGDAYHAYETPEEIAELRAATKGYDRRGRDMPPEECRRRAEQGIKPVIRFRVPIEGSSILEDAIVGTVKRKHKDIIADPIIIKSDGYPTYHFANVIDDHLMRITHVLRSQEWLSSAHLHLLLYRAFGWQAPIFAHLPIVLGKDGQKLSKRHGSVAVQQFCLDGYLPSALLNHIALLGWSLDGSREQFTLQELCRHFSLDRVQRSPAVFDYKKLDWFNGIAIRGIGDQRLEQLLIPYLASDGLIDDPPSAKQRHMLTNAIPLIKERLKRLGDISTMTRFLFQQPPAPAPAELLPNRLDVSQGIIVLQQTNLIISDSSQKSVDTLQQKLRTTAEHYEIRFRDWMMILRIAITGTPISPPLLESCELIGWDEVKKRLRQAIGTLRPSAPADNSAKK